MILKSRNLWWKMAAVTQMKSRRQSTLYSSGNQVGAQVVDLRGCACTNIQAKVCVEMVKHYQQAGKVVFNTIILSFE